MVQHIMRNNLLQGSQHGFINGRSCVTNLLQFFEDVTNYIDQGDPVDVVYLDFQKAIDKVPHQRLLKRSEGDGYKGQGL